MTIKPLPDNTASKMTTITVTVRGMYNDKKVSTSTAESLGDVGIALAVCMGCVWLRRPSRMLQQYLTLPVYSVAHSEQHDIISALMD
jgi:hypothetical protein